MKRPTNESWPQDRLYGGKNEREENRREDVFTREECSPYLDSGKKTSKRSSFQNLVLSSTFRSGCLSIRCRETKTKVIKTANQAKSKKENSNQIHVRVQKRGKMRHSMPVVGLSFNMIGCEVRSGYQSDAHQNQSQFRVLSTNKHTITKLSSGVKFCSK